MHKELIAIVVDVISAKLGDSWKYAVRSTGITLRRVLWKIENQSKMRTKATKYVSMKVGS